MAIFAVIDNSTVMVAFFRELNLRKKINYYIISLELVDFTHEKLLAVKVKYP